MIWLGYFFTVLNYVCFCLSRFMKQKKMMLLLELVAKIITAFALYCFGSLSGAYAFIASVFVLIAANLKERFQKKWLWIFVLFQLLYLLILYYTFAGLSSILIVASISVNLFCVWWLPPQQMRSYGVLNSVLYLAYQISIKNWAGLLEIMVIVSNVVAYMKYKKVA